MLKIETFLIQSYHNLLIQVYVGSIKFMEILRLVLLQQCGTLITLLKLLWYLFSDSPAKRKDYMKVSTMKKLPLQFCTTRWLEDIAVAKRAIIIRPDSKVYITLIYAGSKSKIPKNQSFTRTYSRCFHSSKTTVLCYYCQNIAPISGGVPTRKTNATLYGRVYLCHLAHHIGDIHQEKYNGKGNISGKAGKS